MFERILYTSRASDRMTMRNVYDIIRKAHNRNSDNGLTGGLLFLDGYFVQILEGSPYALEERYRKIISDPRHRDITLRLRETSPELLFPNDWMSLRSADAIDPAVFEAHGYRPGLPVESFSGHQILDFMIDCFATQELIACGV